MKRMILPLIGLVVIGILMMAVPASADVVAHAARPGNQNNPPSPIRITPANATVLYFSGDINERYAIFFNAECSLTGDNDSSWYSIRTQVRRIWPSTTSWATLAPTGTGNALCVDSGRTRKWENHGVQAVYTAPSDGIYQVRFLGRESEAADGSWLGDISVIITN